MAVAPPPLPPRPVAPQPVIATAALIYQRASKMSYGESLYKVRAAAMGQPSLPLQGRAGMKARVQGPQGSARHAVLRAALTPLLRCLATRDPLQCYALVWRVPGIGLAKVPWRAGGRAGRRAGGQSGDDCSPRSHALDSHR
jgi:hypothetical protein